MQKVKSDNRVDTKSMIADYLKTGKVTQCRPAGARSVRKDFKRPPRTRYYYEQI